jgi:hypothetical protein
MTKRERDWHKRNKRDKFWNKVASITDDYVLIKLKIRQLLMRQRPIPEALHQIEAEAIQELHDIILK